MRPVVLTHSPDFHPVYRSSGNTDWSSEFRIPKLRFFNRCHQTIRVWWSGHLKTCNPIPMQLSKWRKIFVIGYKKFRHLNNSEISFTPRRKLEIRKGENTEKEISESSSHPRAYTAIEPEASRHDAPRTTRRASSLRSSAMTTQRTPRHLLHPALNNNIERCG
jgi:hypothetical protein